MLTKHITSFINIGKVIISRLYVTRARVYYLLNTASSPGLVQSPRGFSDNWLGGFDDSRSNKQRHTQVSIDTEDSN